MITVVKNLLSSLVDSGVAKSAEAKNQGVKPAVSSQQKERSAMIDRLVSSLGLDYEARRRYFQLS